MLEPVSCTCLLRPALVVPFCPVSCGPCFFCLVFVVVSRVSGGLCFCCCLSLVALFCSAFGVWGCFGLARSLLTLFPPALPALRLVLWCLLLQSVFCWSLPLVLVVFGTARCHACVVKAWHLSSLLFMATKASALCEALPSTPCCECCFGALLSALRFSSLGDLDLSQDAARAACALLLGLCCFLPPVLAAFPGALLSCCCWPPPAVFSLVFRSLAFSARFAAFVCFGV